MAYLASEEILPVDPFPLSLQHFAHRSPVILNISFTECSGVYWGKGKEEKYEIYQHS